MPNLYTIITLPTLVRSELFVKFSDFNENDKREYLGPIRLEKLKITLTDNRGNVVKFYKNMQWSVKLAVTKLYQY